MSAETRQRVERHLAAILMADVVSSARLMGIDEKGTLARLSGHLRQLFNPKISEHHGRLEKNTGDGVLVEFASVVDAVSCAVQIQRAVIDRESAIASDRRIWFRVGINLGDIVVEDDDILGDGVNVAARLEGLAEPGGICISGTVRDQVGNNLDYSFEDMGEQSLKNIARPVRAYAMSAAAVAATPLEPVRPPRRIIPWRAITVASLAAALVIGLVAWWVWSIGGVWNEAEALRMGEEQENRRIEERHSEQIEGQKRLERLVIDAAAGGKASVQAVAEMRELLGPSIPVIKDIPTEQLPGLVKRIFEDLQKPAAKPEDLPAAIKRVLAEAERQANKLKFADAAQVLDTALAQAESEDRERARGQAALLAERGRIARLQLQYRQAAEFYAKAAKATEFDAAKSWGYMLKAADALSDQGEEFGDNQALREAIAMYRSLVDDPAR